MTDERTTLSTTRLEQIIDVQTGVARLGMDFDAIISYVAQEAMSLTGADGAIVELVEGDEMVYRAVSGLSRDLIGLRLKREGSLSGHCVSIACIQSCEDSETDPRVDRDACRKVGLRSMVVAPLIHQGKAQGVLKVLSDRPHAFDAEDRRILGYLTDLIAATMHHAAWLSNDELFLRATRDSLTGLPNRALFHERLRDNITRAKRMGARVAIVSIDMNGLKQLNDTCGHHAGDAGLKTLADRISRRIRQSDTIARLGGDEFAAILSPVTDRESAQAVIVHLRDSLRDPMVLGDMTYRIDASFGLAVYPDDGEDADRLLELADQAMYLNKRAIKSFV